MKQFLFPSALIALTMFGLLSTKPQKSQLVAAEPFIGEIMLFAGNFEPKGWAFCDGRLLQISQNTALFSILGTTYGGNGTTNFALPDLRGRVPVGQGQGPGLSNYFIGETGGQESNTLSVAQLPAHGHGYTEGNNQATRAAAKTISGTGSGSIQTAGAKSSITQNTGGNQPVENRQPYTGINYVIALQGVYPPRN